MQSVNIMQSTPQFTIVYDTQTCRQSIHEGLPDLLRFPAGHNITLYVACGHYKHLMEKLNINIMTFVNINKALNNSIHIFQVQVNQK